MFKYAQRRAALGQGEKVFFCRLLGSPHPVYWMVPRWAIEAQQISR